MKTVTTSVNEPTGPYKVIYEYTSFLSLVGKSHYPTLHSILPGFIIYVFNPKSFLTLSDHTNLVNYLLGMIQYNFTFKIVNDDDWGFIPIITSLCLKVNLGEDFFNIFELFGNIITNEEPLISEFSDTNFLTSFLPSFSEYLEKDGMAELAYDHDDEEFNLRFHIGTIIYAFKFSQYSISYILHKILNKKMPIWNSTTGAKIIKYVDREE